MNRLCAIIVVLVFLLSSCGIAPTVPVPAPISLITANPNASPTPTPFQPGGAILLPTEQVTLIPSFTPEPLTNTPPPTLEFTATPLPPLTVIPSSARTQYTLYALLDYSNHQVAADETVTYTNQTGVALNQIVMAVEPNHRGGFALDHILLDGNVLNYDLTGHRLTV